MFLVIRSRRIQSTLFDKFLRHELRAAQISIGEAEDEELIVVYDRVSIHVVNGLHQVVATGDPEGVKSCVTLIDVRTESDALNLGRDLSGSLNLTINEMRFWVDYRRLLPYRIREWLPVIRHESDDSQRAARVWQRRDFSGPVLRQDTV